jgi:hypothetical protein
MTRVDRLRTTNQRLCHALERRYPLPFQPRHEPAREALVAALRAAPDHPHDSLEFLRYRERALQRFDLAIATADRGAQ